MIRTTLFLTVLAISSCCANVMAQTQDVSQPAKVYFISDISPESLVKIYQALGKEATDKVAVKISTGESAQSNQLKPTY